MCHALINHTFFERIWPQNPKSLQNSPPYKDLNLQCRKRLTQPYLLGAIACRHCPLPSQWSWMAYPLLPYSYSSSWMGTSFLRCNHTRSPGWTPSSFYACLPVLCKLHWSFQYDFSPVHATFSSPWLLVQHHGLPLTHLVEAVSQERQ